MILPLLGFGCSPTLPPTPQAPHDRPGTIPLVDMAAVDGEMSWTLAFDDDAIATGATNCTYRRTYSGLEDRSTPWLCPSCTHLFEVDVQMDEVDLDCYGQLSGGQPPPPQERLGWSDTGFFRSGLLFAPMGEQGPVDIDGSRHTTAWEATLDLAVGSATLVAEGTFDTSPVVGDPFHGLHEPPTSTCGWQRTLPPAYDGPYSLQVGQQLPDARLEDQCDETVRLHAFAQRYLVIDISASDCGPCQDMAIDARAFSQYMARLHRDVEVVTLLVTSLDALTEPASPELRDAWADTFDLDTPILGDRGLGLTLALDAYPDSLAYPTWIVTSPSMEVLATGQGYGGWGPMVDVIANHHE